MTFDVVKNKMRSIVPRKAFLKFDDEHVCKGIDEMCWMMSVTTEIIKPLFERELVLQK